MPFTYEFPRPAVTADIVLFAMAARDLRVLLIQRKHAPFKGAWAFPGGFVDENEDPDAAAFRELQEETGLGPGTGIALDQVGAFGKPGRDPRGHAVTVAYTGFVLVEPEAKAADDAADARWYSLRDLAKKNAVKLAFDHAEILAVARARVVERTLMYGWPSAVRPERFALAELRRVYEAVLGRAVDTRTFRTKYLRPGLVAPIPRAGRGPAQLYRFRESG